MKLIYSKLDISKNPIITNWYDMTDNMKLIITIECFNKTHIKLDSFLNHIYFYLLNRMNTK
jgi:hypothetical protein